MSNTAIEFQNVGKLYRLGRVGTGTLSHDLNRWWQMTVLGKEDPYLKIGQTNDRAQKGTSDYVWALRDISFKVKQGEVLGIIGKNGAGKSTLLKLLSNITSPTTGCIRYHGRIASLLEVGTGFHAEMTGRENIYMNGSIMGMHHQEITRKLDEIVDFAGVERYLDTPVKRYSSGMTVRLGFAVAAFLDPEILVVDEVLTVGDAEFQKKAIGKMNDVAQGEGRTVLFVSHNMDSMLNLCQKGVLLQNGMVRYSGEIQSTVSEYLSGGNCDFIYTMKESNNPIFISNVRFNGTKQQEKGLFALTESLAVTIEISRNKEAIIDRNLVVSVAIFNSRRVKVCNTEIPVKDGFVGDIFSFTIEYPKNFLMPGRYFVYVAVHLPNVMMYDRQDACAFTITDDGTEFLKYPGVDNGIVRVSPQITFLHT